MYSKQLTLSVISTTIVLELPVFIENIWIDILRFLLTSATLVLDLFQYLLPVLSLRKIPGKEQVQVCFHKIRRQKPALNPPSENKIDVYLHRIMSRYLPLRRREGIWLSFRFLSLYTLLWKFCYEMWCLRFFVLWFVSFGFFVTCRSLSIYIHPGCFQRWTVEGVRALWLKWISSRWTAGAWASASPSIATKGSPPQTYRLLRIEQIFFLIILRFWKIYVDTFVMVQLKA